MDDGTLLFGPRKRIELAFDGSQRDVIISRRRTHRRRGNPASVAAFIMKVMVPEQDRAAIHVPTEDGRRRIHSSPPPLAGPRAIPCDGVAPAGEPE